MNICVESRINSSGSIDILSNDDIPLFRSPSNSPWPCPYLTQFSRLCEFCHPIRCDHVKPPLVIPTCDLCFTTKTSPYLFRRLPSDLL